jgi:hypothetical protein
MAISPEAQARIDAALANPAAHHKNHPGHELAQRELTAAYAEAYPEKGSAAAPGAPSPAPGVTPAPTKSPAERILEIQAGDAWRSKSHPGHAAAMGELTKAYTEQATAAPPPAPVVV